MEEKKKKRLSKKDVIELAVIFAVMFLLFQFVLMSVRVNGPSMVPTYVDGERGIMFRVTPINQPKKGDTVVIDGNDSYGEGEGFVVKRLFATAGDTFEIKDNKVYVNDKEVDDPYRNPDTQMEDYSKITLADNQVFVLGDNRNVSKDSRSVGPIQASDIKAVNGIMYWPLNKIGVMK